MVDLLVANQQRTSPLVSVFRCASEVSYPELAAAAVAAVGVLVVAGSLSAYYDVLVAMIVVYVVA